MSALLCAYVAGLASWQLIRAAGWLAWVTQIAVHDAMHLAKPGRRLRVFFRAWLETATDDLRGMRRVIH